MKTNTKKRTLFTSFLSKVKSFDTFGTSVGFTVDGEEQYKTIFGTCMTFLILLTMTFYA